MFSPDIFAPPDTIKCLSIQQPWSWLIVHGLKDIENRHWDTSYRRWCLVHAGAKYDPDCFARGGAIDPYLFQRYKLPHDIGIPEQMTGYPIKSLVGVAYLEDVVTESDSIWFHGSKGFVLRSAYAFEKPIPYSGALGLFDVPIEVVKDQLPSFAIETMTIH